MIIKVIKKILGIQSPSQKVEPEITAKDLMEAYATGYKDGKNDALYERLTPNEIREILGLPPIRQEESSDEVHTT